MTRAATFIDYFDEIFPGHWLMLCSSTAVGLLDIGVRTSQNLVVHGTVCRLDSFSIDFSKKSVHEQSKINDFVAFIALESTVSISAILVDGQSMIFSPEPLNRDSFHWPSRLQNALNVLRVHDRSQSQLEKLLHSGLMDFVHKGEEHWSTQQPWRMESVEHIKMGCQFGKTEITLLHVAQSSDPQVLLAWLRRLCAESWCVSGCISVLIVAEQSCHPDELKSHLQNLLEIEQIVLEIIVPVHALGLSECVNLGVHWAQSELILLDLSLSIVSLTNVMTCFSGLSALEPHKLIYAGLQDNLISVMSPPMLFRRELFFELGGVLNLGSSAVSVSKQMVHQFISDRRYGVRKCLDDQVNGLALSMQSIVAEDDSFKSAWDSAFEHDALGG